MCSDRPLPTRTITKKLKLRAGTTYLLAAPLRLGAVGWNEIKAATVTAVENEFIGHGHRRSGRIEADSTAQNGIARAAKKVGKFIPRNSGGADRPDDDACVFTRRDNAEPHSVSSQSYPLFGGAVENIYEAARNGLDFVIREGDVRPRPDDWLVLEWPDMCHPREDGGARPNRTVSRIEAEDQKVSKPDNGCLYVKLLRG
jgi:hypothetical protein